MYICRKQSIISIAQCECLFLGDCPFTGLIWPGMILPSQGLAAYLIQFRPSHAASFCTLTSMEQKLKRRPCFFGCRLNRRHPTVLRGGTTWTGDFKCREVKTGLCRKRWMQTGSSGTLIGWKSGQTTYFPLWGRLDGAWLYRLCSLTQQ